MNPKSYQIFAQLCEGLVFEDSTSIALVQKNPGGKELIQHLHKTMSLSHDQDYKPIAKISWSDLKENWGGAWVIVQGETGTGAIRAARGSYEAIASNGGPVQSFKNDRGGNILDFLKGHIGKTVKLYTGRELGDARGLQSKRREQKMGTQTTEVTTDTLVKKFKPLWLKSIRAAQADIKGMVGIMLKNDAYEKAKRKIDHLMSLDGIADQLEAGGDTDSSVVKRTVRSAVVLAAGHHYPEQTGAITTGRYGDKDLQAANSEGQRLLLADIAKGDQKKLGTVLGFFKRGLITG